MTTALQQQVFALDAKYNTQRAPQSPNFRTLYIRRRSQLLRDTNRTSDQWKQYLKLRSAVLQQKFGNSKPELNTPNTNLSRAISKNSIESSVPCGLVTPTKEAEASRALVGGNTISENYAFVGVHHIFDQHTSAVTMVKFANNDKTKLCCCSLDGNLSICDLTSNIPTVSAILKGHSKAVTCLDWSINNDLLVSSSKDTTIRVWSPVDFICLRVLDNPSHAEIFSCLFQPSNNNLLITGDGKGEVRIANVSTGRFMKNSCRLGGKVLSLTSDSIGKMFWAGNDRGEIFSILCELNGGLSKTRKLSMGIPCLITSLSYRAWISREARDPLLLVNATNNSLCIFGIVDEKGGLQLKRIFQNRHQEHQVRSTFCPLMSFRQGACVVTGSEDGSVYFVDIERNGNKSVVNTLQGHSSTVLSISFNYDESLLATSDAQGLVILWKRGNSVM